MAYTKGTRLPGEMASKLGHLDVIESEWVRALVDDFENIEPNVNDDSDTKWTEFTTNNIKPLGHIWAVDGSFVTVKSQNTISNLVPPKEVCFVKTALLTIDKSKIETIDKFHPHPLLLQDILSNSALFHATVLPLKNVKTSIGSNYDAVRNIIHDSLKKDQQGIYNETLKWLAYQKWLNDSSIRSPGFECPHLDCKEEITDGLPFDTDESKCPHCNKIIFLSDMIGFHLDMNEDNAPDAVASRYMLIMEHLMLFSAIRILWDFTDKTLISETLFIKDGPLSLSSQYSKLVPNIRLFLEYTKKENRPLYILGQEKSGTFVDHLSTIARFASPLTKEEPLNYSVLTHEYVHKEVYRTPNLKTPYGKRTNWGEKLYVKTDPSTYFVLNIPVGLYNNDQKFPSSKDLIGLERILATLPSLISYKFECGLYPIELANGIASMSSYPSAKILERFISR